MGLLAKLRSFRTAGRAPVVDVDAAGSRYDDARRAARMSGDPTMPLAGRPASLIERIGLALRVRLAGSVLDRLPHDMRLLLARLAAEPPVPGPRPRR